MYTSTVWSPHTANDINKLESVPLRATRWVTRDYRYTSSLTAMLKDLNWHPLNQWHIDSRLVLMYKVTYMYDLVTIPAFDYLIRNTRQSRHNHPLAYRHIPTPRDYYKYTFFPQISIHWNAPPAHIPVLPTLAQFSTAVLSGGLLIPLNTSILFLSLNYPNTLHRTVQTHFAYYSLLHFS